MYRVIKFTGALSQLCTITIAPNTSAAWFIFENATTDAGVSGPYSLVFSQGSGADVTLQNGKNAIVYCDGAGSGAVVTNALSDIQVTTLEVTGTSALDGAVRLCVYGIYKRTLRAPTKENALVLIAWTLEARTHRSRTRSESELHPQQVQRSA